MRRSLSQLICDDLSDLAHLESDIIASEEAIRFIVEMYNTEGTLTKVHFVHKDQLHSYIKNKINLEQESHHQFVIEVGSRSKEGQRLPDTIHYCAVDLYVRSGKKPIAFVADHYRGHEGYYTPFETIAKELGIHFAVAGGNVYQADSVHCPVFTLKHLSLTASDSKILPLLERIIDERNLYTKFSWHKLPPEYLIFSQSFSMLLNHIDLILDSEKLPVGVDSKILLESNFSSKLTDSIYVIKSSDPKDDNKVRTRAIKLIAAELAGDAVVELEKIDTKYSETALIDICYKEKYPFVHQVLTKALSVSEQYPFNDDSGTNAHPLFELAFCHAVVLELCLSQPKFKQILNNPDILVLMQKNLIDPFELFHYLTEKPRDIIVNPATCNNLCSNLDGLRIIANNLGSHPEINKSLLFQLMTSNKIKSFFKDPILIDLFSRGLIPMEVMEKILPYKIDKKVFSDSTSDNDKIRYLEDTFKIAMSEQGENPDDLFSIPKAETRTNSGNTFNKPNLNIGLLVHSMTNSGLIGKDEPENKGEASSNEDTPRIIVKG